MEYSDTMSHLSRPTIKNYSLGKSKAKTNDAISILVFFILVASKAIGIGLYLITT